MFKMFDTNRSGFLESFELRKLGEVLFSQYFPDSNEADNLGFLTDVLDLDLDGKINQEDFVSYFRQYVMDEELDLPYTPLKMRNSTT